MYNKIIFILKNIIGILLFVLIFDNAMGQNYMGFKIKDVIMIKGNNFTETKSTPNSYGVIVYERSNNKFTQAGKTIESYGYDDNNIVIRCFRFDEVDEEEVMKIVKANNQDYKRVDVGEKQNFFQWIDPKNRYNFILNVIPFEKGLISELKFYIISYEITKE